MAELFLTLIWQFTTLLAILSTLVLCVLVVHRVYRNRHDRRDALRRKELRKLALRLMEDPEGIIEARKEMRKADRRLLARLFEEMRKQLKGEYAERLNSLMLIMGLMNECINRLNHRSWSQRVEAALLLGNFNDPSVILGLCRALEDRHIEVRVAAALSLARLDAVQSVRELIELLIPEGVKPSLAVTEVFRQLKGRHAKEMRRLIRNFALPNTALVLLIDCLGRYGDLNAVEGLLQIYEHPSRAVRIAAMQSLAKLNDPRSVPVILMSLGDESWEVRSQACLAAGAIGDPAAIAILQHLLEDTNWWVRYHAAESLAGFGHAGMMYLQATAETGRPEAANMAWGVLRERGGLLV